MSSRIARARMATLPTIISAYSGSLFEATRLIGQSQFRLV
jgi:hypothetical protein